MVLTPWVYFEDMLIIYHLSKRKPWILHVLDINFGHLLHPSPHYIPNPTYTVNCMTYDHRTVLERTDMQPHADDSKLQYLPYNDFAAWSFQQTIATGIGKMWSGRESI